MRLLIRSIIRLITLSFLFLTTLAAQNNFLNNSSVYQILERHDAKGRININHHQRPFTRKLIYAKLLEIKAIELELNGIERDELNYYLAEYSVNNVSGNGFTFLERNTEGAFRTFEYSDSTFNLTVYPDIGASYAMRDKSRSKTTYYNGLSGYGSIGDNFSFDFDFNDMSFRTIGYSSNYSFNKDRGFELAKFNSPNKFVNHDRTLGAVTFAWDWGLISLRKDYNYWGTGYNGKLILSDKAPSFPQLLLKVNPVDWLEFAYIHGELISSINDSSTYRNSGGTRTHIQLVQKYFVANYITADILSNLKLSVGGSMIYSDRFEPIYLIPVLFFRMADHYLSHSDLNSGNAQIFSSLSFRVPAISSRFDITVFIDELSVTNTDWPRAVGYSAGLKNYDLIFDNLDVEFEYVRIDPFVYLHADPAQTYINRNFLLGDWIGSNSDQLYAAINYKPMHFLNLQTSFEYTRKGDVEDINLPRHQPSQSFLFGDRSYYIAFGFSASYELLNNLFINSELSINNSWGRNNLLDVNDYKFTEISSGLKYGF